MSNAGSVTVTVKKSLYERMVLAALSDMKKGTLHLVLPDGQTMTLGDGKEPITASIRINRPSFFKRVLLYGDIGFGEAYTDGDWDTESITHVIRWVLLNIDNAPSVSGSKVKSVGLNLLKFVNKLQHLRKANSLEGSRKNIAEHYDLNNEFFSLFLDPTMTYSSGYFAKEEMTLQEAQEAKYERLCRQLHLQSTDHVLEIGSGWGGNAIYMARHYGCRVTTVTISAQQYQLAKERIQEAGLQEQVTIVLEDYRKLSGSYDKIVSVEMIEAVGHKFLPVYFKKIHELLKPNGIFALQAITCPDSRYDSLRKGVDWIQKHIFPGSLLPSVGAMNKAINRTGEFTLVDLKDLGLDYARTLAAWRQQFNSKAASIRALGFDEAFLRRWNYYFSYCEAAFAMRNINVMQLVYVRPNTTSR